MRSRPQLEVYLSPPRPCPGERLSARVVLESKRETPYQRIEVRLVGHEERYERSSGDGKSRTSHYHRRDVLRLAATFEAGVLQPGTWERTVAFDLPPDAPPSFRSQLATIAYELEVRVHIPWWPDRRGRYAVTVQPAPRKLDPPRPQLYTTEAGEQRGDDPVLELSLEDTQLVLGGHLAGAVGVTGLGGKRLRRIELSCAAIETAIVKSTAGPRAADRRTWVLHDGTPMEGSSVPFRLAIPDDLPPSFRSSFIRVDHVIEATAVVAFGRDISLRVPAVALRAEGPRAQTHVPLLGSARHEKVWRAALTQARSTRLPGLRDLQGEPERGVAGFRVGHVGVELAEEEGAVRRRRTARDGTVRLSTQASGPCLIAELSWPALGLELRLAERRWTDLGQRHDAYDAQLQRRFTVRAREPQQAGAWLTPALSDALRAFDEVGLDDQGAVVLTRGGVYKVEGLVAFIGRVHHLATVLAELTQRVAPPAALATEAEAWRDLARERQARLRPGDFALLDWSLRGVPLALTHRWEDARVVGSELCTPLPANADPIAWREGLATATGGQPFVAAAQVGVVLPERARPESLLRTADAVALAVTALLGGAPGPYR